MLLFDPFEYTLLMFVDLCCFSQQYTYIYDHLADFPASRSPCSRTHDFLFGRTNLWTQSWDSSWEFLTSWSMPGFGGTRSSFEFYEANHFSGTISTGLDWFGNSKKDMDFIDVLTIVNPFVTVVTLLCTMWCLLAGSWDSCSWSQTFARHVLVGGDWNMTFIFPYIGNNHPN